MVVELAGSVRSDERCVEPVQKSPLAYFAVLSQVSAVDTPCLVLRTDGLAWPQGRQARILGGSLVIRQFVGAFSSYPRILRVTS
jgi:hypothetical protein